MFLLRIYLMGLVGLVPGRSNENLMLILPAESDPAHYPIVACDKRQANCTVTPHGADQWDDIETKLALQDGYGIGFLLDGDELSVTGATAGDLTFNSGLREKRFYDGAFGTCPPNFEAASDYSWVPALGDIESTAARINEAHLINPNRSYVAALLPLVGIEGGIESFHFPPIKDGNGDKYVHSLTAKVEGSGTPMMTWRQAAPDVILVEIPIQGPSAEVRLRKFGEPDASRVLSVRPKRPQRVVELVLGNLVPLDTYNEKVGSPVKHFHLYYKLSETSPRQPRIPHIGRRNVEAVAVNRSLPSIIKLVSTGYKEGGVDRPVCTFAVYESMGF